MDTNDERLMEHTERVVSDMLKYVLAPNELRSEDSVEIVFIDETGVAKTNVANGIEATDEPPFTFNVPSIKISNTETENAFNEVLNDIELFLTQGLDKIRAEYPMYAESTNPYLCNNCIPSSMQLPSSGGYNFLANTQAPIINNNWFAGKNTNGGLNNTFENHYPNNTVRTETCIGELWNDEDEWPVVGNLPKRNKRVANEPNADIEKDINEEVSSEQEDEGTDGVSNASATPPVPDHTQSQNGATITTNNQQYSEYSAANNESAATTTANPFQLSQTALHQTHSTTTTTTAFGVVHQQTSSSTTTNFVSNNLANAALASTPAALYTQALLAQQYWTTILKDAQQRHNLNVQQQAQVSSNSNSNPNNSINSHHNNNHNANNNINAAIYERLAYAHLLQQQIIQQQQQAAIAALLQQKIAIHNAQAANTNYFAQTANAVGSSVAGNANASYANFSLATNEYGRFPNSSTTPAASSHITAAAAAAATATMNINMHMNANLFADANKNDVSGYSNNNSGSNNNNNRNGNNCTSTNSNVSLDLFNLNVADHEERQVACPGIVSRISQSSRD